MPAEAHSNALSEADGDGMSASGPPVPVELESGCAGKDTPADNPGGGSMIAGCAGCDTPDNGSSGCFVVSGCAG